MDREAWQAHNHICISARYTHMPIQPYQGGKYDIHTPSPLHPLPFGFLFHLGYHDVLSKVPLSCLFCTSCQ